MFLRPPPPNKWFFLLASPFLPPSIHPSPHHPPCPRSSHSSADYRLSDGGFRNLISPDCPGSRPPSVVYIWRQNVSAWRGRNSPHRCPRVRLLLSSAAIGRRTEIRRLVVKSSRRSTRCRPSFHWPLPATCEGITEGVTPMCRQVLPPSSAGQRPSLPIERFAAEFIRPRLGVGLCPRKATDGSSLSGISRRRRQYCSRE